MQSLTWTLAALIAVSSSSFSSLFANAQSCSTAVGGYCGNAQGSLCCPVASYCQPWDTNYYQCLSVPTGCSELETDVDYYGGDIGSVSKVSPAECCAKCQATPGCNFFTFVNLDPAGPTCYMKSSKTSSVRKVGALSGRRTLTSVPTPAPTPPPVTTSPPVTTAPPPPSTCATPVGGYCGNGQGVSACCPTSTYCMPWDQYYYQCLATPDGCGAYETDIDYYGNDIANFANIQPWECCTKCKENPACKYFSYLNSNPTVPPTCYLKSSNAGRVRTVGVISGSRLTVTPTPTPAPTPAPATSPVPTLPIPIAPTPAASLCVKHLKNIWYHGNEIGEVVLTDWESCCTACANTKGCVLYSWSKNSATGVYRCSFKSAASNDKTNYGDSKTVTAYSGMVINPLK